MRKEPLVHKYRIKNLQEIIGQDFAVSFLRNSLYKGLLYPLYLFSGLHGSGKTSSARIFALSRCCHNYQKFTNDFSVTIPCESCESCKAFYDRKHPDIIEFDAASHSGVDAIRTIIDNVNLSPLVGDKKFYIIDEAHMLTKSAANACLKMFEDAPLHVHFIMATTEVHKIIETIRSRSIIVPFTQIKKESLIAYIKKITFDEKTKITDAAIELIIDYANGSVRDTINTLEKFIVTYSERIVDETVVKEVLHLISQKEVSSFIEIIIAGNSEDYFNKKEEIQKKIFDTKNLWNMTIKIVQQKIKNTLLAKNEIDLKNQKKYRLLFEKIYEWSDHFLSSLQPFSIFDILFYSILDSNALENFENNSENNNDTPIKTIRTEMQPKNNSTTENLAISSSLQQEILKKVEILDPALHSVLSKGEITILEEKKKICIQFSSLFSFYREFLEIKKEIVKDLLQKYGYDNFSIESIFIDTNNEKELKNSIKISTKENGEKRENFINENSIKEKKDINWKNFSKNSTKQQKQYAPDIVKKMLGSLPQSAQSLIENFPGKTEIIDISNDDIGDI